MLGAVTEHRMGKTITVPSAFLVGASPGFKDRVAGLPGWLRGLFTIGWRGLGKLRWEIAMQSPPLINSALISSVSNHCSDETTTWQLCRRHSLLFSDVCEDL